MPSLVTVVGDPAGVRTSRGSACDEEEQPNPNTNKLEQKHGHKTRVSGEIPELLPYKSRNCASALSMEVGSMRQEPVTFSHSVEGNSL